MEAITIQMNMMQQQMLLLQQQQQMMTMTGNAGGMNQLTQQMQQLQQMQFNLQKQMQAQQPGGVPAQTSAFNSDENAFLNEDLPDLTV